ncbi:hypothetical protein C8J56DRAFT_788066 [Mycena floridula]|nr:hypothetical protein C8J56DRAFT_788066 [Mycena floridula]
MCRSLDLWVQQRILSGPAILDAFVASEKWNVTILSRISSAATFPSQVKVLKVDYGSQAALVDAMKGQDAAVLALSIENNEEAKIQDNLVDAAIAAGVSHFIPSSYTTRVPPILINISADSNCSDISKPPGALEPIFAPKVKSEARLQKLAAEGKIQWTAITAGAFFDWGLTAMPFLGIDLENKRAMLIDGGRVKVHHTLLSTIGQAAVTILSNPKVALNRTAFIHDFFVTQRDILEIAEEVFGTKFEIIDIDSEELYQTSVAGLAAGNGFSAVGIVQASVWCAKNSSSAWDIQDDSKLLDLSQKDLRAEVVKVIDQLRLRD